MLGSSEPSPLASLKYDSIWLMHVSREFQVGPNIPSQITRGFRLLSLYKWPRDGDRGGIWYLVIPNITFWTVCFIILTPSILATFGRGECIYCQSWQKHIATPLLYHSLTEWLLLLLFMSWFLHPLLCMLAQAFCQFFQGFCWVQYISHSLFHSENLHCSTNNTLCSPVHIPILLWWNPVRESLLILAFARYDGKERVWPITCVSYELGITACYRLPQFERVLS